MEKIYKNELDCINVLLNEYYRKSYINEEDSYCEILKIKNLIKNLILKIAGDIILSENQKTERINEALKLLAENTGCVEDCQIAEKILNDLSDNGIIKQKNIDYYYENENIGRWQ